LTRLNNKNKNNNHPIATATTISVLAIVIILVSTSIVTSAAASPTTTTTTAGNTTTTPSAPSAGIELSSQPIYQKQTPPANTFPINQTHVGATHSGNGTLTLPNSTQTIKTSVINGSAIVSLATSSALIKETIRAENGETVTVTAFGIYQFNNPAAALQAGGKGIVTAILQTNSTGILAPLNGMILGGIDDFTSDGNSRVTLWRWESGIPLPTTGTSSNTTMDESSPPSPMNETTTTTNVTTITADDSNATAAAPPEEEVVEEQQQQQITPTIPPNPLFE
jgi:hypothetical protein